MKTLSPKGRSLLSVVAAVYVCLLVCMAGATVIGKVEGSAASQRIYGAWWFTVLWGVLAAAGIGYMLARRVRRALTWVLHASLVIILLGALLTHLTARRGIVHLRVGETTERFYSANKQGLYTAHPLGFVLTLDDFDIDYHEGTRAAADYVSRVTIDDGRSSRSEVVSMNHIISFHARRLYQASYDEDGGGSTFVVNADPWGIPVTYAGYGLLFVSLLWMLVDPKGDWRRLLRHPALKRGALTVALLLTAVGAGWGRTAAEEGPHALPDSCARRLARLNIVYIERVCPLETFAIDFTKKLYGKEHYGDYSAVQVLSGFLFWSNEWMAEPVLKIKKKDLRAKMQLDKYASVRAFLDAQNVEYRLREMVEEYWRGSRDELHKQAAEIDDRIALVMEVCEKVPLRLFPFTQHGVTEWYSPADSLPAEMTAEQQEYVRQILSVVQSYAKEENYARVNETLDLLYKYQQRFGGMSLPSQERTNAEMLYNRIPFVKLLFMLCLGVGLVTFFMEVHRLTRRQEETEQKGRGMLRGVLVGVMALAFAALTLCLALRWIAKGSVPMSNGYETMVLMAWLVMLVSLVACRRFGIALTFGFLLSGFFLLVANLSNMDPQISHVMPVLRSPLLSIHVSMMMVSYALLSMTFICALTAVVVRLAYRLRGQQELWQEPVEALAVLSRIFLYPAMTALGMGIFIGAIWANVSWGNYWSWDPKETWALITFLIYAAVLHPSSLPALRKPMTYHVFMLLAFLSIVMTYFGVNYILGGMHSYA
ncbi:MAG: cytochrome c biogenesis protein CcsA [Bacteroidaceae bacterium]|nr:cytochrome c biogenesis protein CcsA [Bacteroidaceae bacterium]